MRAILKRDASVIEVPQNFATLTKITQDGFFVYKVRYRADPSKVIVSRAYTTLISVVLRPLNRRKINTFANLNPPLINKRLRLRRSLTKDILRQESANKILTFTSDITKKIPNNRALLFTKTRFTDKPLINKRISIKPVQVQTNKDRNISMPVLDRNITQLPSIVQNETGAQIKPNFKRKSNTLIYKNKQDPAKFVGQRTNSISSANRAINGTISKRTPSIQTNMRQATSLVSTLLSRRNYSSQEQLKNSVFFNVPVKEESWWIEIEETIKIPMGDLTEDEFYFTFELVNSDGLDVQTINRPVHHSENIAKLEIPTEAPEIVAFNYGALGRNTLNIKQIDENATKVFLYRKELNKSAPNVDSQYDYVGEINLEQGQGYRKVDDLFASTNPVIYRAIAANNSEILGADFASTVIKQKNPPFKRNKFEREPYFVSISEELQESSIAITLRDVPPGPIAARLLRRDVTIKEKDFTLVTPGGAGSETILLQESSNAPIVIEDSNLKDGRIYEYRVLLIFSDGAEEYAANNLIVEFNPIASSVLELEISTPTVEQSGDDIDVTFTINKNVIQTQGDLIKSFLEEQGITAEFQDQLVENRETLQNLFGVRVTRRNLTTGENEDFGIISSPEFSDKEFGRVRSVKPLQAGLEYKYNFTAHARDTETLFSTLNKVINVRTNVSYSFAPNQWKHPITLQRGNLVSPGSLKRNYSKNTFTFGKVVDSKSSTVSLANVLPSLYSGKASNFGENQMLIQWKVQGDINKIDHFIVILEILGMRTVVGKSHNVSKSNYFQLVDKLTNQECGELTYYIVPVFFDYSRGPELKTNSVVV